MAPSVVDPAPEKAAPRGAVTAIESEAAVRLREILTDRQRVRAEFLLGYVDLAIRGTLEYERFDRVYLGPWWDLPVSDPDLRGWKRAVLRRVLAAGAEHWGHLFLVLNEGTAGRTLTWAEEPRAGSVGGRPPERIRLRLGDPEILLYHRPSTPSHAEELTSFAHEVGERFRRQMD